VAASLSPRCSISCVAAALLGSGPYPTTLRSIDPRRHIICQFCTVTCGNFCSALTARWTMQRTRRRLTHSWMHMLHGLDPCSCPCGRRVSIRSTLFFGSVAWPQQSIRTIGAVSRDVVKLICHHTHAHQPRIDVTIMCVRRTMQAEGRRTEYT
jgi:hypothetical protein